MRWLIRPHCPVAIIRTSREAAESDSDWIAVVVDASAVSDAVLEHGFREARLRQAPILALRVWRWAQTAIPTSR
jgi:hypothetical protein